VIGLEILDLNTEQKITVSEKLN